MKKPYLLLITSILYLVLTGGVSLAKDSDAEKIEALKQAVKMNPDDAEAHSNLGYAYGESGMHKEAIEAFRQAISIDPDDADAHYNLGVTYDFLNDGDSALEQYKILKSLDSELANKLFDFINMD